MHQHVSLCLSLVDVSIYAHMQSSTLVSTKHNMEWFFFSFKIFVKAYYYNYSSCEMLTASVLRGKDKLHWDTSK